MAEMPLFPGLAFIVLLWLAVMAHDRILGDGVAEP